MPEWSKVEVEVLIGVSFVGFALTILLGAQGILDETTKATFALFLFTLFAFIHFQYFHDADGSQKYDFRGEIEQSIIERTSLDAKLKQGYKYVGRVDDDHFVVEAPHKRKRKRTATTPRDEGS